MDDTDCLIFIWLCLQYRESTKTILPLLVSSAVCAVGRGWTVTTRISHSDNCGHLRLFVRVLYSASRSYVMLVTPRSVCERNLTNALRCGRYGSGTADERKPLFDDSKGRNVYEDDSTETGGRGEGPGTVPLGQDDGGAKRPEARAIGAAAKVCLFCYIECLPSFVRPRIFRLLVRRLT